MGFNQIDYRWLPAERVKGPYGSYSYPRISTLIDTLEHLRDVYGDCLVAIDNAHTDELSCAVVERNKDPGPEDQRYRILLSVGEPPEATEKEEQP